MAADEPHWGITQGLLSTVRDRSIAARSDELQPPANLDDAALIASGAVHYAEMCTGCHLAPGMKDTELRAGLYPKPPNLAEQGLRGNPARTFWIIKHGIKMSGMPAWGVTHDDDSIWGMVAFIDQLPSLTPEQYQEMTSGSEAGHSHSEGGHDHADAGTRAEDAKSAGTGHSHDHGAHEHQDPVAPATEIKR